MAARTRPSRTLRRLHRWVVVVAVVLVLCATLLVLLATSLTRMSPGWWRSVRADDPRTAELAEAIENDLVNVMYKVRNEAEEPWSIGLRAADANAWLNTRLGQWLTNRDDNFVWPTQVQNVQVEFDRGLIYIGVELVRDERSQVLSATLRPEFHDDGSLWVRAESVMVGRLPLPADWILKQAESNWPDLLPTSALESPATRRLLDALAGIGPLATDPIVELGDGRRVRVLAMRSADSTLHLTLQTEFED